jgi:glyoxylase-like metal-dependent hydrolase (beta-lactamase superfamily II)
MKFNIIPVTPYQQNCSLLVCEATRKAAVIDPGGDSELILEALNESDAALEKIFLTHGHIDHVGAASELAARFDIPIEGPHRDDLFWLQALASQCQMFGLPPVEPFTPSRWLKDGDQVQFGNVRLEVLHCPGHTPGHVVFFHRQGRIAWVGDVLFKGSIGRTDFPRGDFHTLIASITGKLWPLGEDTAFVPGHGPMSTFGEEMRTNPFVAG